MLETKNQGAGLDKLTRDDFNIKAREINAAIKADTDLMEGATARIDENTEAFEKLVEWAEQDGAISALEAAEARKRITAARDGLAAAGA